MSKENLEQFMNQVTDSEELQARIGDEIDAEALIALGAECGCELTAEDLQGFCVIEGRRDGRRCCSKECFTQKVTNDSQ
ncbi:MAG: Nif11-like leader peptide family natural product precursor [Gammaproteobacteria bacterium]|jgi:hypothetical protein|nr:Nif11-like leader peptide family natural product precursor [Gammaproteobacteria bacterium]MDP7453654.1 Nif11-like leader peptide family natural product precursor [Arenicellales bacterium]|tara:strand:- start:1417 stop:1653 length:237 start_codon:yes stop_codon:yes gene_type:complete